MFDLSRCVVALLLGGLLALTTPPGWADARVRESALAGGWYPAEPEALRGLVDELLDRAKPPTPRPEGTLRALILPHAGYAYSGPTAATGVSLVRGASYRRVLVIAPSHRRQFRGLSIAPVDAFETPLGRVALDTEAIAGLRASPLVSADPAADPREHAIEIELPLLQRALQPGWRLVPVLVGELGEQDYRTAAELLRALGDEDTLVVVSSDFTHYGPRFGYLPFPPTAALSEDIRRLDEGALRLIKARNPAGLLDYQAETGISLCGIRPVAILLQMLGESARIEPVAYTTSGAITGDWHNSVSYAVLAVTQAVPLSTTAPLGGTPSATEQPSLTETELRLLHRLAVAGVTWAVLGEEAVNGDGSLDRLMEDLPPALARPAGAFVTLKRGDALRGCIGYIGPRSPLFQAVLENGVNAARNDRRFPPLSPAELQDLEVEVSVLTEPRPIPGQEAFRVGDQGIILKKDGRQAVFLPEVATEQGWGREETLSQLARKAGLPPDAWRNGAELQVFESKKLAAPYPSSPKTLATAGSP